MLHWLQDFLRPKRKKKDENKRTLKKKNICKVCTVYTFYVSQQFRKVKNDANNLKKKVIKLGW